MNPSLLFASEMRARNIVEKPQFTLEGTTLGQEFAPIINSLKEKKDAIMAGLSRHRKSTAVAAGMIGMLIMSGCGLQSPVSTNENYPDNAVGINQGNITNLCAETPANNSKNKGFISARVTRLFGNNTNDNKALQLGKDNEVVVTFADSKGNIQECLAYSSYTLGGNVNAVNIKNETMSVTTKDNQTIGINVPVVEAFHTDGK